MGGDGQVYYISDSTVIRTDNKTQLRLHNSMSLLKKKKEALICSLKTSKLYVCKLYQHKVLGKSKTEEI